MVKILRVWQKENISGRTREKLWRGDSIFGVYILVREYFYEWDLNPYKK